MDSEQVDLQLTKWFRRSSKGRIVDEKYVVIARFDDNTNQKMLSLRDELMSKGYSVQEWPPHMKIVMKNR